MTPSAYVDAEKLLHESRLQQRIARHSAWAITVVGTALFGYYSASTPYHTPAVSCGIGTALCLALIRGCLQQQQAIEDELATLMRRVALAAYAETIGSMSAAPPADGAKVETPPQ